MDVSAETQKRKMEEDTKSDPELNVITSSHDLDDYDIVATQTMSVAVPYRTTESFRKLVWAAMAKRSPRPSAFIAIKR